MAYNWTTEWPGVYAQHASDCPLRSGGECTCQLISYRASAKAPDERSRLLSPEFSSAIEARNWLRDQRARVTAATAIEDEGPSVRAVIQDYLGSVAEDLARARGGPGYGQERLREATDRLAYVDAELGSRRLQMVRRRHVHTLVVHLEAAGLPSERIDAVVGSLSALFDYAIERDLVDFNPVVPLSVPQTPPPVPATVADVTSQYNGNGNGNHGGAQYGEPTMPYAPAFTAPHSPPMTAGTDEPSDQWTPGVFDNFEFGDDPFSTEPPPPAVPGPPWVASDARAAGRSTPEHTFAPPAAAMPLDAPPQPPQPMPQPQPQPWQYAITETRYGTPTYGTESVPTTQVPAQPA